MEQQTVPCPFCKGSRKCHKCDGTGRRLIPRQGLRRRRLVTCAACRGTGACDLCQRTERKGQDSRAFRAAVPRFNR
jgi:DnaJ-class molecular chaperone